MSNDKKQVGGDHYKHMEMDPAEFCAINDIPFLEGNVIKYVCRHQYKNGIEDLNKAIHYLEILMGHHYNHSYHQSKHSSIKPNMKELIKLVVEWGEDRDLIHHYNANRQMLKVMEEVGELAGGLAKNKRKDIMDAIGDSLVTLIILSAQLELDPEECLRMAYREISSREGETIDGVFVKK
jgi:NTP pyrophosphatase (non-canonical NTP hydrolase)